ncbi:MAG: PQQ-dependent sugar dehydrogenase [Pirellula sp.]|jgi:putative heme-binding domain-containing protein|nr:PQQ-dependent sugar dehydrogenase [Pirellula sp.]
MNQYPRAIVARILLCIGALQIQFLVVDGSENTEAKQGERTVPWTQSRVQGTPDKPPAFALERVFPKLSFRAPVSLHRFPDESHPKNLSSISKGASTTRWVVIEQKGKILSFLGENSNEQAELMIDLANPRPKFSESVSGDGSNINAFSLAFHPRFHENRFVYICYLVQKGKIHPNGTHIARYRVTEENPPKIDYDSETTILRCDAGGHNGCTLEFGPDGNLYISIGDLTDPTPPDVLKTGQDIGDLLASILRIDVDRPSKLRDGSDAMYTIPADNPFVNLSYARGEVYAYGLRNPWRMSFDAKSGDLWVGDVGWEAFEMVYRVRSGSNCGWSIKEGPGDVMPEIKVGPTPIQPADIVLTHADAASVTGGFVYHGTEFPELGGKYVFGDWITRRYWAASFDKDKVTSLEEIAGGEVKPICFATDRAGELFVLEYIDGGQDGGIYKFKRNPAAAAFEQGQFPKSLSETGLFRSTRELIPSNGVHRYELNASMWMEGADTEFHIAIPGSEHAKMFQSEQTTFDWFKSKVLFPKGTVLSKTYSLHGTRVETQLSHYEGPNDWRFYTYRWLEDQSDAVMVPASGEKRPVKVGRYSQMYSWNFGSRTECRICHTPWSGDALGFIEEQLRAPDKEQDSWRTLHELGVIRWDDKNAPKSDVEFQGFIERDAHARSLPLRARSYLHANCAHCHQFGGNGAAAFDVRWNRSESEMKCLDAVPMKGTLGIENGALIKPGEPTESVLFRRISKTGSGRMPHVGSETVDTVGARMIYQWIASMPKNDELRTSFATLTEPIQKGNKKNRIQSIEKLMASQTGALLLAQGMTDGSVHDSLHSEIHVAVAKAQPDIRDYAEHFLPASMRVERLGSVFSAGELLAMEGDATRGKEYFEQGLGQCVQCHRVGESGKQVGPALDKIGTKYSSRDKMLDQLIKPSLVIEADYRSRSVLTSDGETIIGRVLDRNNVQIRLMLQDGKETTVATEDIESEKENALSTMPEGLLAPLTAQQAADLLSYLLSLR